MAEAVIGHAPVLTEAGVSPRDTQTRVQGRSRHVDGGGEAAVDSDQSVGSGTIVLTVENMSCGGCMRKIEAALSEVPGVSMARANLSARRVTVVGDETRGDGDDFTLTLIDALQAKGFKSAEVVGEETSAADTNERDLIVRMAVAGFAAANVMLLSVSVWSGEAFGDMGDGLKTLFHWLSALIALPTVAYAGQPFFQSAVTALKSWRVNMDVPISLGVLLATGLSLFQTMYGEGHVYFDAAVMLLFFLLIGRVLDQRMRNRAAGAAANLLALRAVSADVLQPDGTLRRMSAKALVPGMTIHMAAGERIAVDGTIISGRSDIDNALITGETLPQPVTTDDKVYAGAINISGPIVVRAEAVEDKTVLSEIMRLMTAAEQNRGHFVRLADRAARVYAPAVHILGLVTFLAWMAIGAGWIVAITTAIAVLIITCPCALALAVPAVQVTAVGRLFDNGVLVKAADGLERLAACKRIVFDKTGTLTDGAPVLGAISADAEGMLASASQLAATSRHPYSKALVAAAQARGLNVAPADEVHEHPGEGLSLVGPDGEARLGSAAFCGMSGQRQAVSSIWFRPPIGDAVEFAFREQLKPDAVEVMRELQGAGYEVEILSGDSQAAVAQVAGRLGVKTYRAEVSPADKVAHLERLAEQGQTVLMVGDGLNDAPSLATAHASMSPSEAADIAQTAADAVFQSGKLNPIIETLCVARATEQMSVQNFGIALCYNAVFVPLAMTGFVTPLLAAIAMSASSIAVTANAVRLKGRKLKLIEVTT